MTMSTSASSTSTKQIAESVLRFWFGSGLDTNFSIDKSRAKYWYGGGEEVDNEIREKFGKHVESALDTKSTFVTDLSALGLEGDLAIVILLDQLTRNCYRGQKRAFEGDSIALQVALRWYDDPGKKNEAKEALSVCQRVSLYVTVRHCVCDPPHAVLRFHVLQVRSLGARRLTSSLTVWTPKHLLCISFSKTDNP